MKRHVMMDDVFIYRAHNFFIWCLVCAGKRMIMSTSIEHELTKRALESIHLSRGLNSSIILFPCFASNKWNNFSCLWFVCNHDGVFGLPYDKHVSSIFHMDDLCVATNMMNTCSFQWFVCNHNDILCMSCHEFISRSCLHIDLAYAINFTYLCCANGVMNMNGHVIDDMLLYLAHTWFAWSLMCRSYLWMSLHELLQPRIPMTEDLARRAHRHLAKVTSFYISAHAITFKNWLLFECCFVFLVSLVGYLKGEGTLKKCHIISIDYMVNHTTRSTHLPPCHDEEQESRTTLFKGGEMM